MNADGAHGASVSNFPSASAAPILVDCPDDKCYNVFTWCFVSIQAGTCPDYRQHASLHHCVALALLSRLLPGSEHLAYEVLLDLAFNPEFLP